MNTYCFRFNNSKNTSTILFWFLTTLLTIPLTTTVLLSHSHLLFPIWLLLISLPLMLVSIYRLFKVASEQQSIETVSLSKEGFTSFCFGSVLFSEIYSIWVPVKEIGLYNSYLKILDEKGSWEKRG